jgi:hypothetical protein
LFCNKQQAGSQYAVAWLCGTSLLCACRSSYNLRWEGLLTFHYYSNYQISLVVIIVVVMTAETQCHSAQEK